MKDWFPDINLEGKIVKLSPLSNSHRNGLLQAASDGRLWELWFTVVPGEDNIDNYINNALIGRDEGNTFPFSIIHLESNKIIGSTRYCNAEPEHRRLEIGYTWYAKSFQRTSANTECKYLLLKYAFEDLNCSCVQFKTDWFNLPSRRAIERLGAKQDGILRNDRINSDGTTRDTVVFSIIEKEWHGVRKSLEYKLKKYLT